jgi:hypothetical protein
MQTNRSLPSPTWQQAVAQRRRDRLLRSSKPAHVLLTEDETNATCASLGFVFKIVWEVGPPYAQKVTLQAHSLSSGAALWFDMTPGDQMTQSLVLDPSHPRQRSATLSIVCAILESTHTLLNYPGRGSKFPVASEPSLVNKTLLWCGLAPRSDGAGSSF